MKILALFVFFCRLLLVLSFGAEFQNLGFDDADTGDLTTPSSPRPTGSSTVVKLLPGWNLYLGSDLQSGLFVNQPLLPPQVDYAELGDRQEYGLTEGRFALQLRRASPDSPSWRLEQTGTIPIGIQLLTYRKWYFEMEVRIDGQVVPPLNPQSPENLTSLTNLFYDVSAFAGREVKLEFIGASGPYGWPGFEGIAYIDTIVFLAAQPRILGITYTPQANGITETVIRFNLNPGMNHMLEFRDGLDPSTVWQALPGAPHNSGSVTDTHSGPQRFYRLTIASP